MRSATHKPPFYDWIQRPVMSAVFAYGGAISVWFMFLYLDLKYPTIFDEAPFRLLDSRTYYAFSGVNVGIILWLCLDLASAFRAAVGVRKGQVVGVLMGLWFLGMLQFGAQALHYTWDHESGTSPAKIEAFVNALAPVEAVIARVFMDELERVAPEHRLACSSIDDGYLIAIGDDTWGLNLVRSEDGMSIEASTRPNVSSWVPLGPWESVRTDRYSVTLKLRVVEAASKPERLRKAVGALIGK